MRQRKNSTTTPTSDNENLLITDLENLLTELTEEEMQACWGGIGPAGPDYSLSRVKTIDYQLQIPGGNGGHHHGQTAGGNSGVDSFDSVTFGNGIE